MKFLEMQVWPYWIDYCIIQQRLISREIVTELKIEKVSCLIKAKRLQQLNKKILKRVGGFRVIQIKLTMLKLNRGTIER